MTKTIEEAENEYANENMWYPGETSYESDIIAMKDSFADAFKAGASHALSLPLSQRLTDEERERVRKMYESALEFARFYQRKADSCYNTQCRIDYEVARDIAKSRAGLLEAIFGKELFGEGEG